MESFASGLNLVVMDVAFNESAIIHQQCSAQSVGMGFILRGHSKSASPSYKRSMKVVPNMNGHFVFPETVDMKVKILPERCQKVWILMNKNTLIDMTRDDEESFSLFWEGLQQQKTIVASDKLTSVMRHTLLQVLNCPYRGKVRSLFLESKTLELMSYKLEQIQNSRRKGMSRTATVGPADEERVQYAADLLVQDMQSPPDLSALCSAVGLSRSKLHSSFRLVHGCTPLEYLRDYRLASAKKMLKEGRCNVNEAAYWVGYESVGYFSKLFSARFLKTPKEFLRTNSRC